MHLDLDLDRRNTAPPVLLALETDTRARLERQATVLEAVATRRPPRGCKRYLPPLDA